MPRRRNPYRGGGGGGLSFGNLFGGAGAYSENEFYGIEDPGQVPYDYKGDPSEVVGKPKYKDERGFMNRAAGASNIAAELNYLNDQGDDESRRELALQTALLGEAEKIAEKRNRLQNESFALADDAVRQGQRGRSPFNAEESVVLGGMDYGRDNYVMDNELYGRVLQQKPFASGARRKVAEDTLGQNTAMRGERKAASTFPNELETAQNTSEINRLTSSYGLEGAQGGDYKDAIIKSLVAELQKKNAIPVSEGGAVALPDGRIFEGGYDKEQLGEQPYINDPKFGRVPFGERTKFKTRMPASISQQPGGLQGFQRFLGGGVSPYGASNPLPLSSSMNTPLGDMMVTDSPPAAPRKAAAGQAPTSQLEANTEEAKAAKDKVELAFWIKNLARLFGITKETFPPTSKLRGAFE
jgi:hypothetical protein